MATKPTSELVTDRTLRDVQLLNTKGNWNVEDLNRIGEWQIYIRDLLNEYGYYVQVNPKTDFVKTDLHNMTTNINKIKTNTKALKDAYYTLQEHPLNIGALSVDYITANNIEKILTEIELLSSNMAEAFIYCGTIYCGE